MDCSPPGSSVHGISQTRTLEWVVISFSRRASWPRDRTHVSCIGRWIPYHWAFTHYLSQFEKLTVYVHRAEDLRCQEFQCSLCNHVCCLAVCTKLRLDNLATVSTSGPHLQKCPRLTQGLNSLGDGCSIQAYRMKNLDKSFVFYFF